MLILLLLFTLGLGALKIIDAPTIKKIKSAENAQSAVEYRKRLLRNRTITYWVVFGIVIVLSIVDLYNVDLRNSDITGFDVAENQRAILLSLLAKAGALFLFYWYIKNTNKKEKALGRVSTLTAKEFLDNNNRFALFLRGFDSDIYNEKDIIKGEFSEDTLSKVTSKGLGIPLCAVGMTKEADSAIGGIRVYVDDSTWKDDVYELMQKAELIIIRINDRTSCIWEISQAKSFLNKCTFIADDLIMYKNARTAISQDVSLPEIPLTEDESTPSDKDNRAFFIMPDMQIKEFRGEIGDYNEIIGLDRGAVTKDDIAEYY